MTAAPPIDKLRAFQALLPDLYDRGLALWETRAGCNELAWLADDALAALRALANAGRCILGGDVWEIDESGDPRPTYDNWYHEPTGEDGDVGASEAAAVAFIGSYQRRDEPTIRFTVVWR